MDYGVSIPMLNAFERSVVGLDPSKHVSVSEAKRPSVYIC